MAFKVAKLEDIGDERDQKVFMTIAENWFGGNVQAMLDDYNRIQEKYEELEKQPGVVKPYSAGSEARFKVPHQ